MVKCKIFTACILCLALLLAGATIAVEKPAINKAGDERLVVQLPYSGGSHNPGRDQDDFMTLRFIVSTDGGLNWSGVMGTGDHGMWEAEDEMAWGGAAYDFGAIVDNDNNLHYIVVLDEFTEINNPEERVNGLYDVCTDAAAENVTYTLIVAEGEDGDFTWSDCGKDVDGNLYAIWVNVVTPEEGDPYADIWAAKTTEGNWGEPVMIVHEIDAGDNFPHMTSTVGEYFYVLYQIPTDVAWDHYVAKVPASLEGEVTISATGASSGVYYSYYIGAVNAIAQDVDAGFVYFAVRSDDMSATTVGNSEDGENWRLESIGGAQRYPAVGMDLANEKPYVFSNFGPPGADDILYHHNWYSYDDGWYNGGSWMGQIAHDSIMYQGEQFFNLLYVHNGVWNSDGNLVTGCNVWGNFTPEGFMTNVYDPEAEEWSGSQVIFDIWGERAENEPMVGGYITQCHLVAGSENYIYVAFCGKYGESDIEGPEFETTDVSSVMLEEDKVVSVNVTDASPIYPLQEDPFIGYIMFNWLKVDEEDTAFVWDYGFCDSLDVDENGHGTYYFHLPNEVAHEYWENDTLKTEQVALEAGDIVVFYADGYDESQNYGYGDLCTWIVNDSWTGVDENIAVPFTFEVGNNYPNPFNSTTVIPFSLNRATDVRISIYDVTGRLVVNLFEGSVQAGSHTVAWDGSNVTSGIYIYTLEAAGVRHVGKMTFLR